MAKKISNPVKKPSFPSWAKTYLTNFLDDLERLKYLIPICRSGITMVTHGPNTLRVLADVDGDSQDNEEYKERLKRAEKQAELANAEISSNFLLVHSWAILSLWALVEGLIRGFAAEWLRREKASWSHESFYKLKVRVSKYEQLSRNEKFEYIIDELERSEGAGLRKGVGRFEVILSPIGLGGQVSPAIRDAIFELAQVRNCLAHGSTKADKEVVKNCPWLKLKAGHPMRLDKYAISYYFSACDAYVTDIIYRISESYGKDRTDERAKLYRQAEEVGKRYRTLRTKKPSTRKSQTD